MAAMLGARSGLPGYFTDADAKPNPVVASFEKELRYFIASFKRAEKRATAAQSRQKAFNTLFNLWNSYEGRLEAGYFTQQLLATGDELYQAQEYALARTHCYGRYLGSLGLQRQEEGRMEEYFQSVDKSGLISAALRACIGDAMCQYYLTESEDPRLMHAPSRHIAQSVLRRLQQSSQVALQREPLYWLLYNAVVLTYSICRRMMALGYSGQVVEYLLWASVCMESSVPLMAVKYLQLRVCLYVAVCQCYYDIRQPLEAELFAREHLTKVAELARLEFESSSEATESSERVFREASVKLEVMIFRQSVFETRKKLKSLFRPKIRPTIKELLLQASPRFQTEKLLSEMFKGRAAQFLAVLESLVDTHRRPLEQVVPTTTAGLDLETTTDVYQELFCMGTDLAQKALDQLDEPEKKRFGSGSLMAAVSQGADDIPLPALVQFVRLAYSHKQQEVFTMLAERVTQAAMGSEVAQVRAKGKALQLILAVESLRNDLKRQKTAAEESKLVGGESSPDEPLDRVQQLLQQLQVACCCPGTPPEAVAESLVSSEYDLLLDTALYVWEVARPALARVHSHEWAACRHLLANETGQQYVTILEQLLEVFHELELWQVDPLLHGELCYKLACLQEARADMKHATSASQLIGDAAFILYDRRQLLQCLSVLHAGLKCVSHARKAGYRDQNLCHSGEKVTELEVLHAELLFALTRVRLKLASTIPPPPPADGTQKPSSLKSKVKERQERLEQRERQLSVLTAPEVQVSDEAALLQSCGKDYYLGALLAMLQAVVTPQLQQARKEALLEEAFVHLSQLSQEQRTNQTPAASTPPASTSTPPSPLLLHTTSTSMAFAPAPFEPKSGQKVSYYQLFGRPFTGSNVKVRLADKQLPGLGVEVPAGDGCVLEVHGLQPNEEYVFAVAAYTSRGELVGGGIGQTSRPHLANFHLPLLAAWGYCCQCAYTAGVSSVARRAAQVLWKNFIAPSVLGDSSDHDQQELQLYQVQLSHVSSTPAAILQQFVQSVLIQTQLVTAEGSLLPSQLCVEGPLRASQKLRMELTRRLLAALEVAGMLNDASLVLQAVVMCYGLLVPLIQHSVAAMPVVQTLLHCHAALAQLADLPESPLVCKHAGTTASLHHMIASTAYHAGKVLLSWHKKAVFLLLMDNARGLLLLTMPSSTVPGAKVPKDGPTGGSGLHQSSLLSAALGDPSLSSYTTLSSILPGLLTQQKAGQKKKKVRRKVTTAAEQLSDEAKSMEYKSFEAFLMASQGQSALEDVDITGQEDPVILHAVIAAMQPQAAYKEVHKFRRRPQYLEFFVHLASATVARGQPERVVEWGQEAFSWLIRRNELLLKPQPVHPHKPAALQRKASKSIPPSSMEVSTSLVPVKQTDSIASLKQRAAPPPEGGRSKKSQVVSPKKLSAVSSQITVLKKKHQPGSSQMVPVERGGKFQHSLAPVIEVTRDDIRNKATSVLQSQLPEMWRSHKCRKRLRLVSNEELPWRIQANLLLASCHLHALLEELQKNSSTPAWSGWEKAEGDPITIVPPEWLRFESAGVLINRVIPIHGDSLPGITHKKREDGVSREGRMVDGEGLKESADNCRQQTPLQELQQMIACLQRAVVLAHRGNRWILLQNACHVLWNAVTSLVNTLTQHFGSQPAQEDCAGVTLAAVYGLACKPLYFAASALTDLLLHCGSHSSQSSTLPTSTSLHFTPVLDDCNTMDWVSARRLVLLAVHTLYAHQHWEKMIHVAIKFDDITNHSWAQQLVPVITSAQERLEERMQTHKGTFVEKALDPAAHLDPGPEGHDVYGGVGYALALASVPLDTQATMSRLGVGGSGIYSSSGERVLLLCRTMMIQYLAGASGCVATKDPPDSPMSPSPNIPHSTSEATPSVRQSSIQLSSVIAAYDGAARQLLARGERDLAVQAMHELGNLIYHSGSAKSAGHWWSEALQTILLTKDPLNSWRGLITSSSAGETFLEGCGVWGCLVGGVLAAKLTKYIYRNELDIQLEYTLMAAALFKSLLTSSLPHPLSDLDYLSYQLGPGGRLLPGVELFADRFRCDSITLLSCLQFCAQQLIGRNHSLKVQPVLWLYEHIAHTVCRDVQHTVIAKILKLRSLTHLSFFAEALSLLLEILSGAKLPQTTFEYDKLPDSHVVTAKFSNNLPLIDSKNLKVLAAVFERSLSPSLEAMYGETVVSKVTLARAELYLALAATWTPISQQTIIKHVDQSSFRPSTAISAISVPSSTASGRSDSTVPGGKPHGASLTPSNVKRQLLDHSEGLLVALCCGPHSPNTPKGLELRTSAYLMLAEVALTQHHSSTAVQLSLAAMRLLQGTSSTAKQSVANSGLLGTRLWLECRAMLARSLVGLQPVTKPKSESGSVGLLDCSEQCREGLRECEACGELELMAQLHSTSARHAMTREPPDLEAVTVNAQAALQLLETLPDLSPTARLLQSHTSILLADATCVQGGEGGSVGEEMVKVFEGLGALLKEQIKQESQRNQPENIYKPQLPLFASSKLRLAHTFVLIATQHADLDKKQEHHGLAQKACEDGIETLKTSAFSDPCLMTELWFYNEWLQNTRLAPTPEAHVDSIPLLEACTAVADCGVDYRLAFTCYSELAQMFVTSSKQANHFQQSETLADTSPTTLLEPASRASQVSSRASLKVQESEKKSKAEKEWLKERAGEAFFAWCSIKTTQHIQTITQGLHRLTAEIRNEEVAKLLPDKAVTCLPDFALLELCRPHEVTDILITSVEPVPVDMLAPSAQVVNSIGLNWFKVLAYTQTLLQKCFWQKLALPATNSLHYHCLTPIFYERCRAMLAFLAIHFSPFSILRLPSLHSAFPTLSATQKSTMSFQPAPRQQSVVPPLGPAVDPAYLSAGDAELNVTWFRPFLTTESAKGRHTNPILGLFAMNQKAIKITNTTSINFKSMHGMNAFLVKTTVPALLELYNTWEELAVAAKDYLDTKATTRPISRSPSKQKKADRSLKPPNELQAKVLQGMQKLCDTFGLEFMEDQLPRLEPHSVAGIGKVLQPFSNTTVRGDTYYFFKTLLS